MTADLEAQATQFARQHAALCEAISTVIVGHDEIVEAALSSLYVGGHCLLEGVPGLGKTLLVRTLSRALDLSFKRVQFTPDLMPADIIGTNVIVDDGAGGRAFRFERGPLFAHIVLADEINRATPKTQSALLEAMQEHTVTVGTTTYRLEEPFFVLATQNPIEMEGTYPLPEAQLDRFLLKLLVDYPTRDALNTILERTTEGSGATVEPVAGAADVLSARQLIRDVVVLPEVRDYAARLVLATHPGSEGAVADATRFLRYGASPRAAQAMILAGKARALAAGRFNLSFEDVQHYARAALRHRLILNFEGEAEGCTTDAIIDQVLERVPTLPSS